MMEQKMQLLYSPGSPFARKVRVVIREKGLLTQINEVLCNPHHDDKNLLDINPLGKVPALRVGEFGLYDSPVICAYVDGLHSSSSPLIPAAQEQRIHVLRQQALADGIMEAAVATVMESRREDTVPSRHWLDRWEGRIHRGIKAISSENLPGKKNLGGIAIACALGYLSFRFSGFDWKKIYPELDEWHQRYAGCPSFVETAP